MLSNYGCGRGRLILIAIGIILIFFLFGVVNVASQTENQVWSTPQTIIEGVGLNGGSNIAVDRDGNWHVVYSDIEYSAGGSYPLYSYIRYKNSSLGSDTINRSIKTDICQGNYVNDPSIAVDSNGNLHVIYSEIDSKTCAEKSTISIKYVNNIFGSWSTPQTIIEGVSLNGGSNIAVDRDGNWHVVYSDIEYSAGGSYPLYSYIRYKNSSLGSDTINRSIKTDICQGNYVNDPSIAVDSNGNLHVIYSEIDSKTCAEKSTISIKYVNNIFGSWSTPQTIIEGVSLNGGSNIAVDRDGNWHVVYSDIEYSAGGSYPLYSYIRYKNSSLGSDTINRSIKTDICQGNYVNNPSIAVDSNGNLHVIYSEIDSKTCAEKSTISIKYVNNKSPVEPPIINIIEAKMISPNELGIGVSVTYPKSCPSEALREITFEATINGKFVNKTIPVTNYTTPGTEWGKAGIQNIMFDINRNLLPTTPLRINFTAEEVPRFIDDVKFTLSAIAEYEGGVSSQKSTKDVIILLPVVVLHGYIHPDGYPLPWYKGGNLLTYEGAYKSLSEFLKAKGFNKNKEWGSNLNKDLIRLGFSTNQYVTLWDPEYPKVVGYTHPMKATPNTIKNDVDNILSKVMMFSYAKKVNFVGHSTGGLVSRYYAYTEPNKTNKVITVGTPHEGITKFYQEIFGEKIDSREEAEKMSLIKGTKNTQNIMQWFVPKWDCIITPDYSRINPYFENTFNYPTQSSVKYYYIYASNHETPIELELQNKSSWYSVSKTNYGPGDGYVFADSAGDISGEYNQNIERYQLNTTEKHAFILNDISVKNQILESLNK